MIVRGRPSGLQLFFVLRGSILRQIWKVLLVNIIIAILVTINHGDLFALKITLTAIPFTLIGLPLAIFLGFRNTAAYDRYWEGRKRWGEIVVDSQNMARQCLNLIKHSEPLQLTRGLEDIRIRMIYRTIAYVHALRHLLRETDARDDLRLLISEEELAKLGTVANFPHYLLNQMTQDLRTSVNENHIESCLAANMDTTLSNFLSSAAACERIKSTPIPFSYTLMLHRTAYLYCFLLPFGLVDSIGFMTPFVVGIVAYTFFGLDALGDEIEEPFGDSPNDLALTAICRNIEINMRDALGEQHDLKPLQPVQYCLM
jgi:putative membrane protein